MYTDTTTVQVWRAIGVWALGVGLASLPFLGGQLFVWDDPAFLIAALISIAVGAGLLLFSRRRLARLDDGNREYLMSERGVSVMRGRQVFEQRTLVAQRFLLGLFVVLGILFVSMISAASCGSSTDGFCGTVGRPSDLAMQVSQTAALATGALFAGAVSLRRTHERESERIDRVVAEGQRRRRNDGPLAGASRSGWE